MAGNKVEIKLAPYKFNIHAINDIMKVGGIGLINSTSIASTVVIVTWVIGRCGDQALAGYGLGSRLEIILTPIAFGIGSIVAIAVGANFGAKQFCRAKNIAWLGCAVTFVITAAIGIASGIEPSLWLDRFTSDSEVYKYGALYLGVAGPFYGFFGAGQALYFGNQGAGKMIIRVQISSSRLLLVCSVGILCVVFSWNLSVIFWAVGIGLLIIGTGQSLNMFDPVWNPKGLSKPN
jgi:Na+-driven multidrug efflux pump